MKIKAEHYAAMKAAMSVYSKAEIERYTRKIEEEGRAKDIDMRVRWDLLSATLGSRWICDNLYCYANDDHIDTALRAIMRELVGR